MIKEKGQTLVEALIALGVAITIVSAIVVSVITSLNNAQFGKNQNLANHYAQEGMEIVRQIRNSNWETFSSLASTYYCLASGSSVLSQKGVNGCGQNVGIFVREVDVEHSSPSCNSASKVSVTVSWSDSQCTDSSNSFCHNVSLVSCFANNNLVPTP